MTKLNRKYGAQAVCVLFVIILAVILRILGNSGFYSLATSYVRNLIYIGLVLAWGFSIQKRIMQSKARRYLIIVAAIMLLWLIERTCKYMIFDGTDVVVRYLWYCFYIPMLIVPMYAIFAAACIGQPESYTPKKAKVLYIPALVAVITVLTNDIHQLIFRFPNGVLNRGYDYSYGALYYVVALWIGIEMLGLMGTLIHQCRLPEKKKRVVLPLLILLVGIVYAIIYVVDNSIVKFWAGDMTAVFCLVMMATLEACIQTGLIPSNTYYGELFESASDLSAQIADKDYHVKYIADDVVPISAEQIRESENSELMLSDGIVLHNMPVSGGHVLWTEDASELLHLREKLTDIQEELTDRNVFLQQEYDREKDHKIIEEQNRLFEILESKTQTQIDNISRLTSEYKRANSLTEKKTILSKIVVLGSFIKRRKDFVLSLDATPTIRESKLAGALGESINALSLLDVEGHFVVHTEKDYIHGQILTLAYDFFEDVVEASLDSLRRIDVRVGVTEGKLRIIVLTNFCGSMNRVVAKYPKALIDQDDEETELVLLLEEGVTT